MRLLNYYAAGISQLFFPHICCGCGSDLLSSRQLLCIHCLGSLPETGFAPCANNPVEKNFWGRVDLVAATAHYYFTQHSPLQNILHQFKYRGRPELGFFFGQLMGRALLDSGRFTTIDALVPLPLYKSRQKKRGYNQATCLCDGIASILSIPILHQLLHRRKVTATQTKKNRIQRWQNMENRFVHVPEHAMGHRHILLVDDIITTGATLEACALVLTNASYSVSIAALAYTVSG